MTFGERLALIRIKRGRTKVEMAAELNMTAPGYKRLEDGTGGKTFEKLPALAKALGCRIDDLFPEMDEQNETAAEAKPHACAVLTAEEAEGDFPDGWAM